MLFPEEDSHHLKKWIVKRLENTSDADADVLADYVLALLRHDGDISDVRKLCEEEIPDFLKEDSSVFVRDVFDAIAYRSYLPGAPPPPKHAPVATAALPTAQAPTGLYYDDSAMLGAPTYQPPFQNGSRKRGYNDWDDPNAQNGRDGGFGGRAFKQPRWGGLGGRGPRPDDLNNFRGVPPAMLNYPLSPGQMLPQGAPTPATVGYFDPSKGPVEAIFGMSMAAGHPMPELMPYGRGQFPPKRRKKCRDWERKGYCQRGASCMFQHGDDPVYPTLPSLPFGNMPPAPQPSAVEEYDPSNALMPDLFNGAGPLPGLPPLPDFGHHQRHKGGRHQNRQRRGGDKATFSADGPVFDRTKSTIVVESIPEENFNEEHVKEFFSQYGNIQEVSMQPYKRLAIVKFDSWNAANAAYQSPKVIFDNRFVKVFWYKDDESTLPPSGPMMGGAPGAKKGHRANGFVEGDGPGHQPEIDMEEFARQQEEKQKAFEEKTKKREEVERQREELEKRQKELIAKQLEESARLQARLAARNGNKSKDHDGEPTSKSTTQSEALRKQLAALEAEAREMGLDPDAMSEAPAPWSARGGSYGYGRGRGGWRGHSSPSYSPRGSFRGGARGRANVHAAYAAYSLDNRPKKVVLTGVDFTASDKDETLRQYLFGIGEFTDIQTTPASTEITFKDRKTAEKFFNSVLLVNKTIPGLDPSSPLELSWAGANGSTGSVPTTPGGRTTNPSTPSATAFGATTAPGGAHARNGSSNGVKVTSTNEAGGDASAADDHGDSDDKDVHITLERPTLMPQQQQQQQQQRHYHHQDQSEMDYEVADENQWGY